jgi:endonuclease/exonuclease/phosphatase (EEP) superfamily protein YafD
VHQLLLLFFIFKSSISLAEPLSVTSWNIQGGRNWADVQKEFLKRISPTSDIVTLQEAISETGQPQVLAERGGYDLHFAGHDAILSRVEILERGVLTTNVQTGRVTPWIRVWNNGRTFLVYSPHFSYKVKVSPFIREIRDQEMAVILNHAKGEDAIIAGDLNTVGLIIGGETSVDSAQNRGFSDALNSDGGATHLLLGRLDWILSRGLKIIYGKRGVWGGSDHRWIKAVFEL